MLNPYALEMALFHTLQIPVKQYEEFYAAIIPYIVADFVLADSVASSVTTTLLLSRDLTEDSVLLGTGYQVSPLSLS